METNPRKGFSNNLLVKAMVLEIHEAGFLESSEQLVGCLLRLVFAFGSEFGEIYQGDDTAAGRRSY